MFPTAKPKKKKKRKKKDSKWKNTVTIGAMQKSYLNSGLHAHILCFVRQCRKYITEKGQGPQGKS